MPEKTKAQIPKPTGQYRAALYALRCDDRSFAEYFARNQPHRARSVAEFVDIIDKLGWLSPEGRRGLNLAEEQLTLEAPQNGEAKLKTRLDYARDRLKRTGTNGLKIWSLVTDIGNHEGVADPRDRNWRAPVAAELDSYADLGDLVRVGDRLYHPACAPDEHEGHKESFTRVPSSSPTRVTSS